MSWMRACITTRAIPKRMATHTSDQIVGSAIAELSGIFRRDRPVEHGGDPYLVPSTANFERSSVKSTAALSLTLNSNALLFKPHEP